MERELGPTDQVEAGGADHEHRSFGQRAHEKPARGKTRGEPTGRSFIL